MVHFGDSPPKTLSSIALSGLNVFPDATRWTAVGYYLQWSCPCTSRCRVSSTMTPSPPNKMWKVISERNGSSLERSGTLPAPESNTTTQICPVAPHDGPALQMCPVAPRDGPAL